MGEVKRIFNQAKIDRDIDARMLQPGAHRDALNVNIGESEGGDAGAVENLKGNEEIFGQANITGTTIGYIRDPNTNRVYWFNKGEDGEGGTDAIYEYDAATGDTTTILKDNRNRSKILPTCAPDLIPSLDPTPDDPNERPILEIAFVEPIGGCTDPNAFNYNSNAEFNDGTCIAVVEGCIDPSATNYDPNANTNNGTCTYPPAPVYGCTNPSANNYNPSATANDGSCTFDPDPPDPVYGCTDPSANNYVPGADTNDPNAPCTYDPVTALGVTLTGGGLTVTNGTLVTIGSNVTNAIGSISYAWGDGSTGSSVTFDGFDSVVSTTLTVTDAGRASANQASASTSTTFEAPAPTIYTLTASSTGSVGANMSISSDSISGQEGTEGIAEGVSFTPSVSLSSGYEWVSPPSVSVTGMPSGVSSSGVLGGSSGTTGVASVTVSGTWTPANNVDIQVNWSGGSAQLIPPTCNAYFIQYSGTNLAVYYTNCSTGVESLYNLSNGATSDEILSLTTPYRAPGGDGNIFSITQQ